MKIKYKKMKKKLKKAVEENIRMREQLDKLVEGEDQDD